MTKLWTTPTIIICIVGIVITIVLSIFIIYWFNAHKSEVYLLTPYQDIVTAKDALNVANLWHAQIATKSQLQDSASKGAESNYDGFYMDGELHRGKIKDGNLIDMGAVTNDATGNLWLNGYKPAPPNNNVQPFNTNKWSL